MHIKKQPANLLTSIKYFLHQNKLMQTNLDKTSKY